MSSSPLKKTAKLEKIISCTTQAEFASKGPGLIQKLEGLAKLAEDSLKMAQGATKLADDTLKLASKAPGTKKLSDSVQTLKKARISAKAAEQKAIAARDLAINTEQKLKSQVKNAQDMFSVSGLNANSIPNGAKCYANAEVCSETELKMLDAQGNPNADLMAGKTVAMPGAFSYCNVRRLPDDNTPVTTPKGNDNLPVQLQETSISVASIRYVVWDTKANIYAHMTAYDGGAHAVPSECIGDPISTDD